jgi:AraC-like DNA-binding protein
MHDAPMSYREALPALPLRHLVAAYWCIEHDGVDARGTHRVLPDGCADLICDFTNGTAHARWVGTMTRAVLVTVGAAQRLFGIRFASGGLFPLLDAPLSLLVDGTVELDALPARHWQPPQEAWHAAPDFHTRCALADASLVAALGGLAEDDATALLRALRHAETLPTVAELSRRTGLGVRSLQRRFMEGLGVSPRQHLRYLRFERARRLLESHHGSAAEVALAVGYSDQAHFVREFARFAGVTPGRWR